MRPAIWILLLALAPALWATEPSLRTEPDLNPGDLFTADVLQKGDWSYGQPPKFLPGWFRYGATDRLTLQFDATAWVGGVPDMNARLALIPSEPGESGLAWETMILYFNPRLRHLNDLNSDDRHLFIQRHGMAGYSRLNAGLALGETVTAELSGGASYSNNLIIQNENRDIFHGRSFRHLVDPAASAGFVGRPGDRWSWHFGASYGETFLFMENRPRKWQGTYGFRFIPFRGSRKAILRNMRIEVNALFVYFKDAKEKRSLPVPIFPVFYWNW